MIYSIDNIKNITKEYIIYVDDNNNEVKLPLALCNENWIEYINNNLSNYPKLNEKPISKNDTRCVAERNWFNEKPFYVFYSNPKIKFELKIKKNFLTGKPKRSCYEKFTSINTRLQKCGWTTFDLG